MGVGLCHCAPSYLSPCGWALGYCTGRFSLKEIAGSSGHWRSSSAHPQNPTHHTRHNRFPARDFAIDTLNLRTECCYLFTQGDNDTHPLWYAQETEGTVFDIMHQRNFPTAPTGITNQRSLITKPTRRHRFKLSFKPEQ